MRIGFLRWCLLLGQALALQAQVSLDPNRVLGVYEGFWSAQNGQNGRVHVQLRPLGNGQYDGFIALLHAKSLIAATALQPAVLSNQVIRFTGAPSSSSSGDLLPELQTQLTWRAGSVSGTLAGEVGTGKFEAAKADRKSPTLGAPPPKGAVVLFDGKDSGRWETMIWPITPEGSLQVGKGDLKAKDRFVNYKLHLEFRLPYRPEARGQARANSGVFLQSKYEVQILDSFGLFPLHADDCAGIYRVAAPTSNASLPPLEWQTFDITYVEANVGLKRTPIITVEHNGVAVIDHISLPESVAKAGTGGGEAEGGFLMLQDHGHPVEFRNIWVEPFFSALRIRGD